MKGGNLYLLIIFISLTICEDAFSETWKLKEVTTKGRGALTKIYYEYNNGLLERQIIKIASSGVSQTITTTYKNNKKGKKKEAIVTTESFIPTTNDTFVTKTIHNYFYKDDLLVKEISIRRDEPTNVTITITKEFKYDECGNVISIIQKNDNSMMITTNDIKFSYDYLKDCLISVTKRINKTIIDDITTGTTTTITRFEYDGGKKKKQILEVAGSNSKIEETFEYDQNGNSTKSYSTIGTAEYQWEKFD